MAVNIYVAKNNNCTFFDINTIDINTKCKF